MIKKHHAHRETSRRCQERDKANNDDSKKQSKVRLSDHEWARIALSMLAICSLQMCLVKYDLRQQVDTSVYLVTT